MWLLSPVVLCLPSSHLLHPFIPKCPSETQALPCSYASCVVKPQGDIDLCPTRELWRTLGHPVWRWVCCSRFCLLVPWAAQPACQCRQPLRVSSQPFALSSVPCLHLKVSKVPKVSMPGKDPMMLLTPPTAPLSANGPVIKAT